MIINFFYFTGFSSSCKQTFAVLEVTWKKMQKAKMILMMLNGGTQKVTQIKRSEPFKCSNFRLEYDLV